MLCTPWWLAHDLHGSLSRAISLRQIKISSISVLVLKVSNFGAYAFILFLLVNWPAQVEDILSVLVPLKGFEEKSLRVVF